MGTTGIGALGLLVIAAAVGTPAAAQSHGPKHVRVSVVTGGPAFCRDGRGHPVHGWRWCADRGRRRGPRIVARRGAVNRYNGRAVWAPAPWGTVRWRWVDPTYTVLPAGLLVELIGDRHFGRIRRHADWLGLRGPLSARCLDPAYGPLVLEMIGTRRTRRLPRSGRPVRAGAGARLALALAVVVAGCDSEPEDSLARHISLVPAAQDDGAAIVELVGADITAVTSDHGDVFFLTRGDTTRVVVVRTEPGPLAFDLRVADPMDTPVGTVLQVAGGDNALRNAASYRLDVNP